MHISSHVTNKRDIDESYTQISSQVIDYRGTNELTNRFVHLSSDNRDTDKLTHISVDLI
jgi:hypothetical protein